MSAATILTLANGRSIDLRDPRSHAISFEVIAEHLGKEARYNGATPGKFYSVAEHLCRGADAIIHSRLPNEWDESSRLAAYFLLHDGHEHTLKDKTTPYKRTIAEECEAQFGILAEHVLTVFKNIEHRHDVAIHEAAGLQWPPPSDIATQVKHWDLVMFVTEWRDLMGGAEHPNWAPYEGIKPLAENIVLPWPWDVAQRQYLARCMKLLPALKDTLALVPLEVEHRGVIR